MERGEDQGAPGQESLDRSEDPDQVETEGQVQGVEGFDRIAGRNGDLPLIPSLPRRGRGWWS